MYILRVLRYLGPAHPRVYPPGFARRIVEMVEPMRSLPRPKIEVGCIEGLLGFRVLGLVTTNPTKI